MGGGAASLKVVVGVHAVCGSVLAFTVGLLSFDELLWHPAKVIAAAVSVAARIFLLIIVVSFPESRGLKFYLRSL